jgi:hypothetical protein
MLKVIFFLSLCLGGFQVEARMGGVTQGEAADCFPLDGNTNLQGQSQVIIKAVNNETDKLFEEIKKEFLSSPLCAPENVFNNPKEKLSPVLFNQLIEEMRFMIRSEDPYFTRQIKTERFRELVKDYQLSGDILKYGLNLLATYKDTSEGRFDAMARLRGIMLQEMAAISKNNPAYKRDLISEGLVSRGVFTEDEEGQIECPFLSLEAFRDAVAGREQVLMSTNKTKILNSNLLTIVDYSRPSNERRLFVIDLKNKKVLHNTWVAHGGGKDRLQANGVDNRGSSPKTSNMMGSGLSSEGFYIAKNAGHGDVFLNNLILEGIDENNRNMASRGIVMHGWRTPSSGYAEKSWEMSEGKSPKRIPGRDLYKTFMTTDFKNTQEDLFDLTQEISSASLGRDFMDATDGCLGVPDTKMGHVDRKDRDKSQLELLRDDLPGSLMFNYNGRGKTKSQFLR